MAFLGDDEEILNSSSRHLASRGRSGSVETEVELFKQPTAHPRSTSRAVAEGGRESPVSMPEGQDPRTKSHTHGKSSKSNLVGGSSSSAVKSQESDQSSYEVDEPERGIMFTRDLARPGIVVTREYTVETQRKREDHRPDAWNANSFGEGIPMRHNWDGPNDA